MYDLNHKILRVDIAGLPLAWIGYQEAVKFYYTDNVAYGLGKNSFKLHGGVSSITGKRSVLEINSIVATYGKNPQIANLYIPPLNNLALFKRDSFICMYCGTQMPKHKLSRDHIIPLNQGGTNEWNNVITACKRCNNQKADRTPEDAHMKLLAIPFTPTRAEYIYLQARNVLADQMDFLEAHFPKTSRLRHS